MASKPASKRASKTSPLRRRAANSRTIKKTAPAGKTSATITDIAQFFTHTTPQMETFMTQGKTQFDKITNEATAIGRDNFEAMNKSMTIFAKGLEDITRTAMALAQTNAEKQARLFKDAMGTKTINEWAEAQNRIAQTNFDDFMAGLTQISEVSLRVMTESAEPFNKQMTKTMKKASEALAA
jgi:phasin family protein